MHLVHECPLCKKKAAPPLPISTVAPPSDAGSTSFPVPAAVEPSFQDQKAVAMMEAAKKYSQSVEDLAAITNRINALEDELAIAKKHYHELLAAQNSANGEMRALLDSLAANIKPKHDAATAIAEVPLTEQVPHEGDLPF
jgi:alpha-beta hydrolase superfamily lysophospholipase